MCLCASFATCRIARLVSSDFHPTSFSTCFWIAEKMIRSLKTAILTGWAALAFHLLLNGFLSIFEPPNRAIFPAAKAIPVDSK
jgi:hypothetical protein